MSCCHLAVSTKPYARTRHQAPHACVEATSPMPHPPVVAVPQAGEQLGADGTALPAAGLIYERLQAILELSQTGARAESQPLSPLSSMGQLSPARSARAPPHRPAVPAAAAAAPARLQPRTRLPKPCLAAGARPAWKEDWAPALAGDTSAAPAGKRDGFSAARSSPAKQQQGAHRGWGAEG